MLLGTYCSALATIEAQAASSVATSLSPSHDPGLICLG
jgi:hypothetical protein